MTSIPDTQNILVIDDEAFVLKVTTRMLQNMGFKNVYSAQNASQALSIVTDPKLSIHFILTDLNMPDVDGLELLRKFSEMNYQGDVIL